MEEKEKDWPLGGWIIKVFRTETRYLIVFRLQQNLYRQLLCPSLYFQSEEHQSRVTQVKIMPYQTQSGMVHMHENKIIMIFIRGH